MGGLQSFPEFPSRTLVEGQSSWYQDFEKYPIGHFLMSMVPPEFYTSFIKQGADHNTHIPYEHRHQQVPRHQEGHQSAHEEERKIRRDNAPPRPQTASPGGRNNELEKLKRENKELQTSLKDVQLVGEDLQREKELLLIRILTRFAIKRLTCATNIVIGIPEITIRSGRVNLNEQSIDVSAKKKHMFSDVLNSATMGAMGLQKRWLPKGGNQPASLSAMQTKLDVKPVNIEDKLKKLRKEVSSSMVPIVQRAYIEAFWNRECIPVLKPFVKACLHLCWKMVVQSPPMRFKLVVTKGQHFDANLYKEYILSGTTIDFVVWPALLLHDGGPLIAKGIAQPVGRNKIESSERN
ncbi:hypothetical protein MAR_023714 [Mya arenaria]|uniref:Mitochondria-eating protein C-terminal domain-containing protein n=1 Tax=Mya arenaria TaxID=6604 RepID=A0ABY7DR17_MYAAR|nr:hypothetical protein MAR_023714 [Mya arenaria]